MTETTIGKYIARFRQETPQPRDQRSGVREEDFWWIPARSNATHDDGSDANTDASTRSKMTQSRSIRWEDELLSDNSSLSTEDGHGINAASFSLPSSSLSASMPSLLASSSSSAEPTATTSRTPATPTAATGVETRPDRSGHHLYAPPSDFLDGFVVLEDRRPIVSESQEFDGEEDVIAVEASLENPEIVIQRIRRRLGYHGHAHTLHVQPVFEPTPTYSPIRDQQLDLAELDGSPFDDGLSSSGQSASSHDAVVIMDTTESLPTLGISPLHDIEEQLDAFSLQESMEFSAVGGTSQAATGLKDSPGKDAEEVKEVRPPLQLDESVASVPGDDSASSSSYSAATADMREGKVAIDHTPPTQAESCSATDEPSRLLMKREDQGKQPSVETLPPEVIHAVLSDVDHPDQASIDTTDSEVPRPVVPAESSSTKQSPKDKDLPRLPPLSPARSPLMTPIVRSNAPSPRASVASSDEVITTETAKTLDNLLSFVVQSWGESPFGETTSPSQGEGHQAEPTTSSMQEETSEIVAPTLAECDEKSANDGVLDQVHMNDGDLEGAFSDDPIVMMLTDRIAVFEAALEELQTREDDGVHKTST